MIDSFPHQLVVTRQLPYPLRQSLELFIVMRGDFTIVGECLFADLTSCGQLHSGLDDLLDKAHTYLVEVGASLWLGLLLGMFGYWL